MCWFGGSRKFFAGRQTSHFPHIRGGIGCRTGEARSIGGHFPPTLAGRGQSLGAFHRGRRGVVNFQVISIGVGETWSIGVRFPSTESGAGQLSAVFHQRQQNVVNRKVFFIEGPFSPTFWSIKQRFPTICLFFQRARKRRKPLTRHFRRECGKHPSIDQRIDGKRGLIDQKQPETIPRMEIAR